MSFRFLDAQPGWHVRDLDAALAFYRALGFEPGHRAGDHHQVLHRDAVTVHLSTEEEGAGGCQILVDDVDAVFVTARDLGAEILYDGLGDRPWGCRDFTLRDPDGNQLTFSQELEA